MVWISRWLKEESAKEEPGQLIPDTLHRCMAKTVSLVVLSVHWSRMSVVLTIVAVSPVGAGIVSVFTSFSIHRE